ncbi:arabinose-5-phosphate isomerase [Sphingobium sp. B2D3A]|uniref:KpsF/GutQ family sugar-phosphate isomerase n=1 Tax=unclassified Sphingobium TaxID=2611147 RepID=UPI0022254FDA|nr:MULTISPECIES: KpsF/GutQ family sugar-phosphate isomerase [unclassified Sphingobium]MCW2338492.1 arabinose-5-phosphate isomerase [Sphingobium sp. B2D3A]MCW2384950.1 arabinose-5-phosphate isomerase [Sphingobium sp. B2D3D]
MLKEAEALHVLADSLGRSFSIAVENVLETERRVVISGLGKSGHIGKKIAATLAATGTPSFFVHASEAAHGDLGMLETGDLLIVISNSGFTQELRPLVAHAKSINIRIIAIVSKLESPLAKAADVVLQLPAMEEACPVKMAPTTSTTMTLALGDALAISVMRRRGVDREAMAKWHPGGSLGNRFSPIGDIIDRRRPLPLVGLDAPLRDAIFEMTAVAKGAVGVTDNAGKLVGVITDGDLRRNFHLIHTGRARDIMSHSPKTISSSAIADDAVKLMTDARVTVLFVMDSQQPSRTIGLLHIHDLGHLL